jgi:hypothetical protein
MTQTELTQSEMTQTELTQSEPTQTEMTQSQRTWNWATRSYRTRSQSSAGTGIQSPVARYCTFLAMDTAWSAKRSW